MAGSLTDYSELKILDWLLGGVAFTPPATYYAALFTAAPSDSAGGTEVTGGSYTRVAITKNQTNFPAAAAGAISNGTVITFPTPSADWGTVVGMALMDAASAGNVVLWASFTGVTVPTGVVASFAIGAFTLTLD